MREDFDLELNAFLEDQFSQPVVVDDVPADPFQKFIESATLAGCGGTGWSTVEGLNTEAQMFDRQAAATIRKNREPRNHWDEDLTPKQEPPQQLEKSDRLERRKLNYKTWILEELALGKTVSELIEFAQKTDPNVARLIDEVAREMKLA